MGVWGAIANKMEASQETCFGGQNNTGFSPDYQMVCSIHIDFLERLGIEIGSAPLIPKNMCLLSSSLKIISSAPQLPENI